VGRGGRGISRVASLSASNVGTVSDRCVPVCVLIGPALAAVGLGTVSIGFAGSGGVLIAAVEATAGGVALGAELELAVGAGECC
jgi:hypothetical protein